MQGSRRHLGYRYQDLQVIAQTPTSNGNAHAETTAHTIKDAATATAGVAFVASTPNEEHTPSEVTFDDGIGDQQPDTGPDSRRHRAGSKAPVQRCDHHRGNLSG